MTGAREERCANCGEALAGAWCHACGQRAMDLRASFLDLLAELVRETFELDGRVPRTLWTLFRHPGELTRAFMEGRRASFTPPFRLYLACSLLWLAVASAVSLVQDWSDEEIAGVELRIEQRDEGLAAGAEEPRRSGATSPGRGGSLDGRRAIGDFSFNVVVGEELEEDLPSAEGSFEAAQAFVLAWRTRLMAPDEAAAYEQGPEWARVQERLAQNWEANQGTHSGTWWLARVVPSTSILTLPLLLGMLWLVNGPRRRGGVVEATVAALHLNAFGYLVFALFFATLGAEGTLATAVELAVLLSVPVHVFFAMRRVWGRGIWGTLWRWAVLGVLYLVAFLVVIAFGIIYGVLLG